MIEARYEFLRMSYMRIVWALLVLGVVTGAAMAMAMVAMLHDTASPEEFLVSATSTMTLAITRGPFAVAISVVLGIVVASRDLRCGASGTTPVLFPRRGRLFSARLSVIGMGAAGIASATAMVSAYAATLLLPAGVLADLAVVACVVVMFILSQVCFAIIGATLALIAGSSGVAAAIAFGWILIVEPGVRVAVVATGSLSAITEYLPLTASNIMVSSMTTESAANEFIPLSANPATASLSLMFLAAVLVVWAWTVFRSRILACR